MDFFGGDGVGWMFIEHFYNTKKYGLNQKLFVQTLFLAHHITYSHTEKIVFMSCFKLFIILGSLLQRALWIP